MQKEHSSTQNDFLLSVDNLHNELIDLFSDYFSKWNKEHGLRTTATALYDYFRHHAELEEITNAPDNYKTECITQILRETHKLKDDSDSAFRKLIILIKHGVEQSNHQLILKKHSDFSDTLNNVQEKIFQFSIEHGIVKKYLKDNIEKYVDFNKKIIDMAKSFPLNGHLVVYETDDGSASYFLELNKPVIEMSDNEYVYYKLLIDDDSLNNITGIYVDSTNPKALAFCVDKIFRKFFKNHFGRIFQNIANAERIFLPNQTTPGFEIFKSILYMPLIYSAEKPSCSKLMLGLDSINIFIDFSRKIYEFFLKTTTIFELQNTVFSAFEIMIYFDALIQNDGEHSDMRALLHLLFNEALLFFKDIFQNFKLVVSNENLLLFQTDIEKKLQAFDIVIKNLARDIDATKKTEHAFCATPELNIACKQSIIRYNALKHVDEKIKKFLENLNGPVTSAPADVFSGSATHFTSHSTSGSKLMTDNEYVEKTCPTGLL